PALAFAELGQRNVGRVVARRRAALPLQRLGVRRLDAGPAAFIARRLEVMLVDRDAPQPPDAVLEHGLIVVHAGAEAESTRAARARLEQPRADSGRAPVFGDMDHGSRARVERQRRARTRFARSRDDTPTLIARSDARAGHVEAGERNLLVAVDGEYRGERAEVEVVQVVAVRGRHVLDAVPGLRYREAPLGLRDPLIERAAERRLTLGGR